MKHLCLISILALTAVSAAAQSRIYRPRPCKPVPILVRNPYKIKAVNGVSSKTARVADYVEFQTMEPIYSDETYPTSVFDKGTSIYAVVTERKHRHFPLVRGKLELALEPLFLWDGNKLEMGIARHGPLRLNRDERMLGEDEQRKLATRNRRVSKPCQFERTNCVAGRGDATVSIIVSGIAAAGPAGVTSVSKKEETRFIAATRFLTSQRTLQSS